eukprot:Hpha_TRINITY_DN33629_c0_g1::TRINITY_DN33629_c0_g1_i1::g.43162::m.43162/K00557/trmA; tRNA (uracil-5-)-methyltransferase
MGEEGDDAGWMRCEPEKYEEILAGHVRITRERFADHVQHLPPADFTVYPSPPTHFRLRCKFLVAGNEKETSVSEEEAEVEEEGEGGEGREPLRHAGWTDGAIHPVDEYPSASMIICEAMPKVVARLGKSRRLRGGLRGINYLSTLSGDLLVTLVYERSALGPRWQREAERARSDIGIDFIAHSKGVKRLIGGRACVEERLPAPGGGELLYRQIAGSFSNPNGHMAASTLKWLAECAEVAQVGAATDLLELYCGNGNHTVCLAQRFRRVLGVEINRNLVAVAHVNLMNNGRRNAWVLRAPSQDFCSKMLRHQQWRLSMDKYAKDSVPKPGEVTEAAATPAEVEALRRFAEEQRAGLGEEEREKGEAVLDFGAVLCDPPRAGLDAATLQLVSRYRMVLYISCNPDALARDLALLTPPKGRHRVHRFAVFDHFPYTGHLECGAMLLAD